MGNPAPIKGRRLKVVNPQKRMPDMILHTKDVMIPIVKHMPFKQSYDVPFSENRHQILRAQNYKNNPALLFSETPLRTLRDSLENSLEVNQNLCILIFIFTFLFLK